MPIGSLSGKYRTVMFGFTPNASPWNQTSGPGSITSSTTTTLNWDSGSLDPTKTVKWGPQTFDEMMLGYVQEPRFPIFKKDGMEVLTGTKVESVEERANVLGPRPWIHHRHA